MSNKKKKKNISRKATKDTAINPLKTATEPESDGKGTASCEETQRIEIPDTGSDTGHGTETEEVQKTCAEDEITALREALQLKKMQPRRPWIRRCAPPLRWKT